MSSPLIRVTVYPNVVGWVQKRSIDLRIVADHRSKKVEVTTVTAADAVLAANPNVAEACTGLSRKGGDRLVIGVVSRRQEHVNVASRKSREGQIEIDVEFAKVLKF
jgi:hypothetical protein